MKKAFALLITISSIELINAQHSAFIAGGFSLFGGDDSRTRNVVALPTITIFPGFKFVQKKDFSVFAAAPLSIGLSFQNDQNSKLITYAGFDLPVTINMNIGGGFNQQSKSKSGFFFGAGVGYHISEDELYFENEIIKYHLRATGILLNAGPCFRFNLDPKNSAGLLIRFSWLSSYHDHHTNVFGIGLIFLD